MRKLAGAVLLIVAVCFLGFLATQLIGPRGLKLGTGNDPTSAPSDPSAQEVAHSIPAVSSEASPELTKAANTQTAGDSLDQPLSRDAANPSGEDFETRGGSVRASIGSGNSEQPSDKSPRPGGAGSANGGSAVSQPNRDGNSPMSTAGNASANGAGGSSASRSGSSPTNHDGDSAAGDSAASDDAGSTSGAGAPAAPHPGSTSNPDSTWTRSSASTVPPSDGAFDRGGATGSTPSGSVGSSSVGQDAPGGSTTDSFASSSIGGSGVGGLGGASVPSGSGGSSGHVPGDSPTVPGDPFHASGDAPFHGLDAGGSGGSPVSDASSSPGSPSNGAGPDGSPGPSSSTDRPPKQVPEPSLMLMLGAGVATALGRRSRKR